MFQHIKLTHKDRITLGLMCRIKQHGICTCRSVSRGGSLSSAQLLVFSRPVLLKELLPLPQPLCLLLLSLLHLVVGDTIPGVGLDATTGKVAILHSLLNRMDRFIFTAGDFEWAHTCTHTHAHTHEVCKTSTGEPKRCELSVGIIRRFVFQTQCSLQPGVKGSHLCCC